MRISDWSSDVGSSDLPGRARPATAARRPPAPAAGSRSTSRLRATATRCATARTRATHAAACRGGRARSEEHTSELQSLMRISYAVFCLKKKKTTTKHIEGTITLKESSEHIKAQSTSD